MFEAIRANKRRSTWLICVMGGLLVGLGAVCGAVYDPTHGPATGAGTALVVWLVLLAIALTQGGSVLLLSSRAKKIKKEDAPQLWNIVEEMTIASGLGKPPSIHVIQDDVPNAFAVGQKPENSAVAVTTGLLRRLNRDELQGVIAHEIGHIKNLDVRFMTIASVMVGAIVIIADVFLRSLWYGGGRRRGGGKGSGQAQLIMVAIAIAIAILAPLAARLLYFACSRQREYLADASAAQFTRYPYGLASALEKISGHMNPKAKPNRALAPLFIVNPLQSRSAVGMFSTHPSTEKRVDILRSMGGHAGLADYESAYRKVTGKGGVLGSSVLKSARSVKAREASAEPDTKKDALGRAREVTDLLDRMVQFLLIPCMCGVRIKIPPGFKRDTIPCPRCGRKHEVPHAESADKILGGKPEKEQDLKYRRKGEGWESFKCTCGKTLQLSPAFDSDSIQCHGCRRKIVIQ